MATLYGKNYTGANGTPGSAGTNDVRQDAPYLVESLRGQATTDNSGGTGTNPYPTRNIFDNGKASGAKVARQLVQVDTTQTSYQTPWADLRRASSSF